MARPDPQAEFRDRLADILQYTEVEQRFEEMERAVVDELAKVPTTQTEHITHLVMYLKILREFKRGTANVHQLHALKDSGYKANAG